MRNRALHDALREFALEAAALLCEEQEKGAELEYDVADEGSGRGPALYRYRPLTDRFIADRWPRLRELPGCAAAADALGAGAAAYLRLNGLRGERAEPALQAMLERLYEDATGFGFPEERFERVYGDVERTLFQDSLHATVAAALQGVVIESDRVELGDGLSLVRGERTDAPPEAVWPDDREDGPATLCVLERDVAPDDPIPAAEVRERVGVVVTALRLFKPGRVGPAGVAWRQSEGGRWTALELEAPGPGRGEPWELLTDDEQHLRDLVEAIGRASPGDAVSFALGRFEMGCSRRLHAEALSDYLLALRALLDATTEAGRASLGLRLAALCAEEGERRGLQRRLEAALALERFVMGGGGADRELEDWIGAESPRALVSEIEHHLRALLRDVICGYLEPDLKAVADDILLESSGTIEIEARDLRAEAQAEAQPGPHPDPEPEEQPEPETQPKPDAEPEPHPDPEPEPEQAALDGVTPSADWGFTDDAESYSAPV